MNRTKSVHTQITELRTGNVYQFFLKASSLEDAYNKTIKEAKDIAPKDSIFAPLCSDFFKIGPGLRIDPLDYFETESPTREPYDLNYRWEAIDDDE